jgi:hypothetical protein
MIKEGFNVSSSKRENSFFESAYLDNSRRNNRNALDLFEYDDPVDPNDYDDPVDLNDYEDPIDNDYEDPIDNDYEDPVDNDFTDDPVEEPIDLDADEREFDYDPDDVDFNTLDFEEDPEEEEFDSDVNDDSAFFDLDTDDYSSFLKALDDELEYHTEDDRTKIPLYLKLEPDVEYKAVVMGKLPGKYIFNILSPRSSKPMRAVSISDIDYEATINAINNMLD